MTESGGYNGPATDRAAADERAHQAADALRAALGVAEVGTCVILGSGWSPAAERIGQTRASVRSSEIPGYRPAAVPGHSGELRLVQSGQRQVLVQMGRTHLYEGHGVAAVVHGVRTAAALGVTTLILTNAAGGINPAWWPGTTVLISDHINATGATPLSGPTFLDMTEVYSPQLRALCHEVAPDLPEGVYMQLRGPAYETPAEVRMAAAVGAHLVGMSTALEAIAAREAGMSVLGISLVTNLAAGLTGERLDHTDVLAVAKASAERMGQTLGRVCERL